MHGGTSVGQEWSCRNAWPRPVHGGVCICICICLLQLVARTRPRNVLPNSRRAGRLPTLAPARCACRSLGFPAICQASSCSSLNLPGHFNKWLLIRVPALAIASTPDETARGQAASARGVHGGTARKTTFDNVSRLAQSVKQAHDQVRRYW